jgi:hypothetical protein
MKIKLSQLRSIIRETIDSDFTEDEMLNFRQGLGVERFGSVMGKQPDNTAYALTKKKASAAYENAMKKHASSWTNYSKENPKLDDYELTDIAMDSLVDFFDNNPDWGRWAQILNLSRDKIKEEVSSAVCQAMGIDVYQ